MNQNDKSFVLRSTDLNLFYFSQICSCKNTCCRKKTSKSEGCPCKNANLSCCENCKCGTKKAACKNKANRVVVNTNPSAFARHQEQQANAEREIKVSSSFPWCYKSKTREFAGIRIYLHVLHHTKCFVFVFSTHTFLKHSQGEMLSVLSKRLKYFYSITVPSIIVINFHLKNCGCCQKNGNFVKEDFANRSVLNRCYFFYRNLSNN